MLELKNKKKENIKHAMSKRLDRNRKPIRYSAEHRLSTSRQVQFETSKNRRMPKLTKILF